MGEHLKAMAKIVHTPTFESAVVNIISGCTLLPAELEGLKIFNLSAMAGKKRKGGDGDYASPLLQGGGKKRKTPSSTDYAPIVKQIPPTSNTVEWLFSQCKFMLTPQRRSVMPANFEQLAFLRVNRHLWDLLLL
ncbi:hypothetical protein F442_02481 [Phytophthora nicotianae P10297]|uniref:HAT C-terminal dimerisation domain-containing protein n=2 Tax=Phytophthora nicotianae TaxID=4792 RepID=W2ZYS4_PHYNI|nr:hypothetical protein F442_02481 [Phytophthora nicotianae P10297]